MVEPMLLYGCEIWGEEMLRKPNLLRKWMSLQRKLLIAAIGAYGTVSHEAVRVVAGVPPIDLQVEERVLVMADVRDGGDRAEAKAVRRQELMDKWEERWRRSRKGSETKKYWRSVRERMEIEIMLDHYVVAFLTGHGNFKGKLFGFQLVDDALCGCGEVEYAEHVLLECGMFELERRELEDVVRAEGLEWSLESMVKPEVRSCFERVARRIGRAKKESEREELEAAIR